ncbi:phosphatidylserine/phosphatidylglycerophosphate/cardiolipin synthase-like enzyme [Sphingomonas zeicaulis]|uniref:phospholipase D-like domain-containing protein n=1 Tax=Sphingomonas zeicaulis TaxID=1632740 RepID=UPI003D206586
MTGVAAPFIDAANAMRVEGPDCQPFAVHDGCAVEPLVEAAEMYPAMERLVLDARESVWLAFRVFDPDTRTRSNEAKARGLADWTALIVDALQRGVSVRVMIADFEPVMADYLHAGSWASFRRLRDAAAPLDPVIAARLEIMIVMHEGELGWVWRQALRLAVGVRARKVVAKLLEGDAADGGLSVRPGLWRYVLWRSGKPARIRALPLLPRLWPATYHQKFAVIDGTVAVAGGLDLDERRWDDRRHRQRADQTWHDVSAIVRGPAVADAARHFATLWNAELPRYRAVVAEWSNGAGETLQLDPLTDAVELPAPAPGGHARVQFLRTRSRLSTSPVAFGPRAHVRELKAAHRSLIVGARRQLYIEAQFFRSAAAARWVVQALRASPELEVIILVANVPEEIAFEGQGDNPAHRHGEYLQARALKRVVRSGGRDRVGLFTLAKREGVRRDEQDFVEDRGTAFGSGLIHIHAKLLIADGDACLLSSANINGRSFEWDTEFGMLWAHDDEGIAAFRDHLWRQLFANHLDGNATLDDWRRTALANVDATPETRKGFVVPYQIGRARRFGRPYWFVPDDLV